MERGFQMMQTCSCTVLQNPKIIPSFFIWHVYLPLDATSCIMHIIMCHMRTVCYVYMCLFILLQQIGAEVHISLYSQIQGQ